MLRLYSFLAPALLALLKCIALFSPRIRENFKAREGLMARWRSAKWKPRPIWIHVSSVGELEQVRPVIEQLSQNKSRDVVVSFFSTSVTRLTKDWTFAAYVDFLPFDSIHEMRELVEILKPSLLVLNRYDLWPNHLLAAKEKGVPVVLVNASTPPLGWMGWLSLHFRSSLFRMIDAWTFVDAEAATAWNPYLLEHVRGLVTGNPRVDRALARVEIALQEGKAKAQLAKWQKKSFCLVAGSTWEKDEDLLLHTWAKVKGEKSLVLVPHEPHEAHLERLEKEIARSGFSVKRFSKIGADSFEADILLVDQRGILAEIYGLGQLSYVGGGFGRQIHSIIEPIAHGVPVAFGPHYSRSPEAVTLLATGSAISIPSSSDTSAFHHWIESMKGEGEVRGRAMESLRVFLQIHRGAGDRVARFLESVLS